MNIVFKPAVKQEAKLRLAIAGPSGSGKTYSALAIATHLAPGGRIALADTEHGSAAKYSDLFRFDAVNLDAPFHPDNYVEVIKAAQAAGYDVLILDSLTHAWSGAGGLLEIVDQIAARMKTSNTFAAWKDATPIQNRLVEAILGAGLHIIATMRSKQDYVQDKDEKGYTRIRKVGMAPQQREGFEYEFDVFGDIDIEHRMVISKTRCPELADRVFAKPGKEVAEILRRWLVAGPAPTTTPPDTTARADPPPASTTRRSYKDTPHPWDGNTVLHYLQDAAEWFAANRPGDKANGRFDACLGMIDKSSDHHQLFRFVFGEPSVKKLTEPQKLAVAKWVDPWKDPQTGEWLPGRPDDFKAELAALVDSAVEFA